MSVLRRLLGRMNRTGGEIVEWTPADPRFRSADEAAEHGEARTGVLVGIDRRLDGGTDEHRLALVVDGGPPTGVRIAAPWLHRIRLGLPVSVRLADDGRAVLDPPALCAAWGIPDEDAAQRLLRDAPADGCRDTALDARVQKALKGWPAERATIGPITRRMVMGMPTQDFTIDLELGDGRLVRAAQHVPFYAAWLAAPGTEVPVVVDPRRPDRAYVDWPSAAGEHAGRPGALADDPPPGSVAELLER